MSESAPECGELARRLRLLLDVAEIERGEPLPFSSIQQYVESRHGSLSRAKWFYMLGGQGPKNRDRYLLVLLEDLFGVDHGFLSGAAPAPERVARLCGEVRLLRLRRVCAVFDREFGLELSSDALAKIESVLAGEGGAGLPSRDTSA